MNNCIFCQIIAGQKPCHKVYEDKNFFAFLDNSPYALGHTMLIPKKHYRWVWQIKEPGLNKAAGKISKAIMEAIPITTVTYLTLGWLSEHAHLHLIPRKTGDGLINEESLGRINYTSKEMTDIAKRITKNI